ncbi:hypothetical protein VNO80_10600 [Phaseolus coccineus]|uniref:Protein kinase domain-containing protein n=1 Tax=Phaseolus coccineus TaxID=3886 RepID=A0AAN9NEV3_PHACN
MNWVRGDSLGHGTFATVNIVVPANGSTFFPSPLAVKSSVSHNASLLKNEKEILYRLGSSPYIINCFGHDHTVENGEEFYNVFLEQAAGGSLADQVKKHGGSLPEPFVRRCTRSIVEGLRHIHEHGFVHCDVKLQNVLVFDNGQVARMMKHLSENETIPTYMYWLNEGRNKDYQRFPYIKINFDGAFIILGNKAGAGGLVRDWREFIFGFSSGLANCLVLETKLEAIKIRIETTISKGYKNLMVESDSKVAIDIITSLVAQQSNEDTSQSQNVISSIIEISKTTNNIH